MVQLRTFLAILLIIRVSCGQLQECPSCCNHTFTEDNIMEGTPIPRQPFWDCNEDEKFVIHVAKCFSECPYHVSVQGTQLVSYTDCVRVNYDIEIASGRLWAIIIIKKNSLEIRCRNVI